MALILISIAGSARLALLIGLGTAILAAFKYVYDNVLRPRWYLRNIPGPPHESFLIGNIRSLIAGVAGSTHDGWHNAYGNVVTYAGLGSMPRLSIMDKRALHHILVSEPYKFPKSELDRRFLAGILGEGLVVVEGHDHARQRRVMNPSFGPAHIKTMYPLFLEKALHLRNTLLKIIENSPSQPTPLNMLEYTGRVTLDVIGEAGFGYDINAIERGNQNELAASFEYLFANNQSFSWFAIFVNYFPVFRFIMSWTDRGKSIKHALATMRTIGNALVAEKKEALVAQSGPGATAASIVGRDLLTALIKANTAADLKPSQKLTDEEVMAQISTMLLAGTDTTANAIAWAIYGMCKSPETQNRLRAEINNVPNDSPSYDELNALPYLDAVVRETLRLYAPVMGTVRTATEDCFVPLGEPIVDLKGVTHSEIFIPKNAAIYVPMINLNKRVQVWGQDAHEFVPERWLPGGAGALPEGAMEMPSLAFPTFLAGARACIGFRFTLLEMKVILFSLLRAVKIELAVPVDDIEPKVFIVSHPSVKSQKAKGSQLPVLLTPVTAAD